MSRCAGQMITGRLRPTVCAVCRYLLLLLVCSCTTLAKGTNEPAAKVSMSGYGLFGNLQLKGLLSVLQRPGDKPTTFGANFVEDAVLVLFSRLTRDGYLHPTIRAQVRMENGEELTFTWTEPLGEPLPRPFAAKRVDFKVEPGVLFYLDEIRFDGVNAMSLRDAAHFFIETDAIVRRKRNRVYSPERFQASVKNFEEGLERLGFQSARIATTNLVVNTNTGLVQVDVLVREGPRSVVRSIRKEIIPAETNSAPEVTLIETNVVFSRMWQEDFAQSLRREQYPAGHADVRVQIAQLAREQQESTNFIDLSARVFPGPEITVGAVSFSGENKARESMMRRRVNIHEGDLLNPIKAEQGRYRLARLGIFDAVELQYEKVDQTTRDVEYRVKEGKRINFSLLAGYGSYEKLRGGFELEQYDLWGLGHYARLKAVQSFKSSSADYTYTMPEFLGEDFDVFFNAAGLIREEIDFTRREFGGGAGVNRHFREISTDLGVRYNYQVLTATREDFSPAYGLKEANVGSFIFDMRHDRRDNPLTPRKGYKLFTTLELASPALFGNVDYQRVETSFSVHQPISRLQWIHFGFSHGFITTPGEPSEELPFNKRFFPGGDNSIRGYQFGEAAPRDGSGHLVGAESYMLGNIEFEQGLTKTWSIVGFFDVLGEATRIQDYPFNEELYAIGIGLRWKTIIGPVRLEYGHNLNPRPADPSGTLHVSVGFPF